MRSCHLLCLTHSGVTEGSVWFVSAASVLPGLKAHCYFPNNVQNMYSQIMKYLSSDRCMSATALTCVYLELRVKHMGLLQAYPFSLL